MPIRREAGTLDAVTVDSTVRSRLWRAGELEAEDFPFEKISDYLDQDGALVWVDICDPDSHLLTELAEELTLQRLAVEDAVSHRERPKATRYSTHTFLTAYAVDISADDTDHRAGLTVSPVSAFVLKRGIVTVRDGNGFDIDAVLARWEENADLLKYGVGALVHGLLDVVVDGHFAAVQVLDDRMEALEDDLFDERAATVRCSGAPTASARIWSRCAGWCCRCVRWPTLSCGTARTSTRPPSSTPGTATPLPGAVETANDQSYGVMKFSLGKGGYSWRFSSAIGTYTDAGAARCHDGGPDHALGLGGQPRPVRVAPADLVLAFGVQRDDVPGAEVVGVVALPRFAGLTGRPGPAGGIGQVAVVVLEVALAVLRRLRQPGRRRTLQELEPAPALVERGLEVT